jgi:hypothetical protein
MQAIAVSIRPCVIDRSSVKRLYLSEKNIGFAKISTNRSSHKYLNSLFRIGSFLEEYQMSAELTT